MPLIKDCENCGEPFSVRPAKGHQRFCSETCARQKREEAHADLTCKQCGGIFHVTRIREQGRQFCSKACTTAYEAVHGREAARHERKQYIDLTCKQCGSAFRYTESAIAEYRRKYDKDPPYCSLKCFGLAQRARAEEKHTVPCKNCGQPFVRTRKPGSGTFYATQQLCSRQCKNEWVSKVYREKHGLPQVTRRIKKGYTILRFPAQDGIPTREVFEHRHVMEQFLGRPLLSTETVHHKRAWDKTTNTMENLELRTGNHGPGGAVEDLVPWCVEMLETYSMFVTDELRKRLKAAIIERSSKHD